jgi:hypothetical protein
MLMPRVTLMTRRFQGSTAKSCGRPRKDMDRSWKDRCLARGARVGVDPSRLSGLKVPGQLNIPLGVVGHAQGPSNPPQVIKAPTDWQRLYAVLEGVLIHMTAVNEYDVEIVDEVEPSPVTSQAKPTRGEKFCDPMPHGAFPRNPVEPTQSPSSGRWPNHCDFLDGIHARPGRRLWGHPSVSAVSDQYRAVALPIRVVRLGMDPRGVVIGEFFLAA